MSKLGKSLGFVALVMGLVLAGFLVLGPDADTQSNGGADTLLNVATLTAKSETGFYREQSYTGRVEASRRSSVGFELGGLVTEIAVEEGDLVRTGRTIAVLDTQILRSRRGELTSARDRSISDQSLATSTLSRVEKAAALNAVSVQAVDEARREVEATSAALAQANAAIQSIDVQINKASLTAPFDAIVARRFVDEGAIVASGTPIVDLLETGPLEARVGVSSSAADQLKPGDGVVLRIDSRTYSGTVSAILPLKDASTRSIDVIVRFVAEDDGARHGDLARLTLNHRVSEPGFWLPLASLTESSRGLWAVYVADPASSGTAIVSRREVQIIHQETDRVYVRGTLRSGEAVISSGLQRLTPGLRVSVGADERELASFDAEYADHD